MKTITLKPLNHRGVLQIGIYFVYDDNIRHHLRKLADIKWSKTNRCFYLPFSDKNKKELLKHLKLENWYVDYRQILNYDVKQIPIATKRGKKPKKRPISEANKEVIRRFVNYLEGLRFSKSTVQTYFTFVADFIAFIGEKPLEELNNTDVRLFIESIIKEKNYAISTHRQLISAIKHFANFYPSCKIDNLELKRPTKDKYLPTVLSKEEVIDILRATRNLKHRAVLVLIYAAGLRISEALNLKLQDIDIDRRQIIIKKAKGRKDRFVVMAESFVPIFKNYFLTYRPKYFFVEGPNGDQYSASSVRAFLKRSCKAAQIKKRVTPHTLRHSYATHLIENGVGIRHVQELLGHTKPETTMIYTHIAKKDLLQIQSPLDTTLIEITKSDKKDQNIFLSGNITR